MFYNRSKELESLGKNWREDKFSFVVIYGRRRVGKTELIKQFIKDKPHVYHLVIQGSEEVQRKKLVEEVANQVGERVPEIEDWDETVEYLAEKLGEKKMVLAIDEFPYLIEQNKSILSYFQALIDEHLKDTNSMLILCGSSISLMESEVMGHKSPLFGRRTAQIDLKPFDFKQALNMVKYRFKNAIRSYAITGGTPMYLGLFDYSKSLRTNIREEIFQKRSLLYNEPEFLLREELRRPSRYMSILEAIASGRTTPNEISGKTKVEVGPLSNYLKKLRRLRFIKREIPVTAHKKKSRRSLYKIKDNFLRFWFRFVATNRSNIEEAPEIVIEDEILPNLNKFVSKSFEEICQEAVWEQIREGRIGRYTKVGKWWYKDEEIDIAALNEKENKILLGECKWSKDKVGAELLEDLKRKAKQVRWKQDEREETYALFSKSGFTKELKEIAREEDLQLYDLKRLEKFLDK